MSENLQPNFFLKKGVISTYLKTKTEDFGREKERISRTYCKTGTSILEQKLVQLIDSLKRITTKSLY